mmetsp:Transcript_26358/g.61313  ORF Transcript_26358/g.61313 Transcript_26358/m.61313 type:complete len:131 (+) Transcript_26358:1155-1547(+)
MQLPVPPAEKEGDLGVPLDKGVHKMLVSKQNGFREGQDTEARNNLKDRIVALGQLCFICHNNIQQPHGKYSALEVHFRRLFRNVKYSVASMMKQLADQEPNWTPDDFWWSCAFSFVWILRCPPEELLTLT